MQTIAKYERELKAVRSDIPNPPPIWQFADYCQRSVDTKGTCSLETIAAEAQVQEYIIYLWLKSDETLNDIYNFFANEYKHYKAFDIIKSIDFLEQNPRLATDYIKRSKYANKHGFISDLDLKHFDITKQSNTNATPSKHFFPTLNPIYYDLLNVSSRYVLCYGGAGSGKSYAVVDWLLYKIYNAADGIRILYGRKNLTHIKQSQFALFKARISHYGLEDDFVINKTDYRITCKHNNAELIAIGLDDPEKIKSIFDPVAVWIEEATELNEEDFHQLDLRLRAKDKDANNKLQIIFTFNPISKKHWLRKRFMDNIEIEIGVPFTCSNTITIADLDVTLETYILKTNYKHNKHLPLQYVAALEQMKTINPDYYEVYVNAEWGEAGQGWLFKRDFFEEYSELPSDVRGIIYCDPNLSKKGKGDTTAICKLLFSPSNQLYYVEDVICRSYSDANELLKDLFGLFHNDGRLFGIAFDGNVNQESQWTQHVRNFAQVYNTPVPIIDYKHYHTDDLAKNASMLWAEGRIKFRPGLKQTTDGEEFLGQIYSFTGKKHNSKVKDDAPDALICAVQALFERGYRLTNNNLTNIKNLI